MKNNPSPAQKNGDIDHFFSMVSNILSTYQHREPNNIETAYFTYFQKKYTDDDNVSVEDIVAYYNDKFSDISQLNFFEKQHYGLQELHYVAVNFFCSYLSQTSRIFYDQTEYVFEYPVTLKDDLLSLNLCLVTKLDFQSRITENELFFYTGIDTYLDLATNLITHFSTVKIGEHLLFQGSDFSLNFTNLEECLTIYTEVISMLRGENTYSVVRKFPLSTEQKMLQSLFNLSAIFFVLCHEYSHYFIRKHLKLRLSKKDEEAMCDLLSIKSILHVNNRLAYSGAEIAMYMLYSVNFDEDILKKQLNSALYPTVSERHEILLQSLFEKSDIKNLNVSTIYSVIPEIWFSKEYFKMITRPAISNRFYFLLEKEFPNAEKGVLQTLSNGISNYCTSLPPMKSASDLMLLRNNDGDIEHGVLINTQSALSAFLSTLISIESEKNATNIIFIFFYIIFSISTSTEKLSNDGAKILSLILEESQLTFNDLKTKSLSVCNLSESQFQSEFNYLHLKGIVGLKNETVFLNDIIINIAT